MDVPAGATVTLTCTTTTPQGPTLPQWQINGVEFTASRLPADFTVDGSSIRFTADANVDIRCFFSIISGGSVVSICSEPSSIGVEGPRNNGKLKPRLRHPFERV